MKIINIKQKNKNNTNCIVSFIDNSVADSTAFNMELSMDIVMREKLIKDVILDNENFERIQKEQRIIDAKQTAYNFASYTMRTKKQIINKLLMQNFTEEEIQHAIKFLTEFNLIDDELFAKKYTNDILIKKKVGKFKILNLLIAKGIDKNIAESTIKNYYPEENSFENLIEIANKKLRSLQVKNKTPEKIKASLFNHIIAKGFTNEEAKKIIKIILSEQN
jgi:regulatory protein